MADPIRHSDVDTFLKRAEQAAADADAATLENVRQRFLRAEAAWRALAEKTERSARMRADEFARVRAALNGRNPESRHEGAAPMEPRGRKGPPLALP